MNDNTVNSVLNLDGHISAYFLVLFVQLHDRFGSPPPMPPLKSLCSQISKNEFWGTLIPKSQGNV